MNACCTGGARAWSAAVYQADWFEAEPEWSLETLMHDFADVQALYARAAAQGQAVVVSFL